MTSPPVVMNSGSIWSWHHTETEMKGNQAGKYGGPQEKGPGRKALARSLCSVPASGPVSMSWDLPRPLVSCRHPLVS